MRQLRFTIVIPAVLVPLLAIAALVSGVLPAARAALPFLNSGTAEPPGRGVDDGTATATPGGGETPTATPSGPGLPDTSHIVRPYPAIDAYLPGIEYGMRLVQTTRNASVDHPGWVDITLDLMVTSLNTDKAFQPHLTEGTDQCSL